MADKHIKLLFLFIAGAVLGWFLFAEYDVYINDQFSYNAGVGTGWQIITALCCGILFIPLMTGIIALIKDNSRPIKFLGWLSAVVLLIVALYQAGIADLLYF